MHDLATMLRRLPAQKRMQVCLYLCHQYTTKRPMPYVMRRVFGKVLRFFVSTLAPRHPTLREAAATQTVAVLAHDRAPLGLPSCGLWFAFSDGGVSHLQTYMYVKDATSFGMCLVRRRLPLRYASTDAAHALLLLAQSS